MRNVSRRNVLLGSAATLGVGLQTGCSSLGLAPTTTRFQETEEEYLLRAHIAAIEPHEGTSRGPGDETRIPRYYDLSPKNKRKYAPKWVYNADSVNFHHLGMGFGGDEFQVSDVMLRRICYANTFDVSFIDMGKSEIRAQRGHTPVVDRVLFGIRGCEIVELSDPKEKWQRHIVLREAIPDHKGFYCVIGVWNRKKNRVWATSGSTVPNANSMYGQFRSPPAKKVANMLPTGLYEYVVGVHRGKWGGCFRHATKAPVLRTINDMSYGTDDKWDTDSRNACDNIHPGLGQVQDVMFSSAGCQTMPGGYRDGAGNSGLAKRPNGEWQKLREAAGLSGQKVSSRENGLTYKYVLLTGRDFRWAWHTRTDRMLDPRMRRMRFGSYGDRVNSMQASLGLVGDGDFGRQSLMRILQLQENENLMKDGIFRLGLEVT